MKCQIHSHKTFGFVLRHCEYSQFQCWMLSVVERYLIKIEWSNNPCGNISTYAVSRKRIIVCFTRLDSCFRAHHSMKFIMVGHIGKILLGLCLIKYHCCRVWESTSSQSKRYICLLCSLELGAFKHLNLKFLILQNLLS